MWDIGVATWVRTSPLTDDGRSELASKVSAWGFDVIELPVERPGDWDPYRAADLLAALGLTATVCLVMPPGRELFDRTWSPRRRTTCDTSWKSGRRSAARSRPGRRTARSAVPGAVEDRRQVYAELRENLATVDEYAAQNDVRVAVEPPRCMDGGATNAAPVVIAECDRNAGQQCGPTA